jgi:hypothetical protein
MDFHDEEKRMKKKSTPLPFTFTSPFTSANKVVQLVAYALLLFSIHGYCGSQIKPPSAALIEHIDALRSTDMEVSVSIVSGFNDSNLYKDEETAYMVSDGGMVEVAGDTLSSKSLADYLKRINDSKLGAVEVQKITPITRNGLRKIHFVFQIIVEPVTSKTVFGIIRKPRDQVTLDGLHEACSVVGQTARGSIPYFDCESYVYGALDSYLGVKESIPKAQRACFPANIPPWRVLEISAQLDIPHKSEDIAAPLIIEALRKKFPCPKP